MSAMFSTAWASPPALLHARLRDSRVGNVERAAKLLGEQGSRLGEFFDNDPRGRELPGYLRQLGEHLVRREPCAACR